MCFRSPLKACRSSSLAKYLFERPHSVMVSTTRPISCLTLCSRSGVPICPRKYLETTMLVACCDHDFGISTSRCSKTTSPRSLPISAPRSSQSISSNGSVPGSVKKRGKARPAAFFVRGFLCLDVRRGGSAGLDRLLAGTRGLKRSALLHVSTPIRSGDRRRTPDPPCPERGRLSVVDWRPRHTRSWGVLDEDPVALRPTNMRASVGFVNSDPTRYCAFVLGQSQDVDIC